MARSPTRKFPLSIQLDVPEPENVAKPAGRPPRRAPGGRTTVLGLDAAIPVELDATPFLRDKLSRPPRKSTVPPPVRIRRWRMLPFAALGPLWALWLSSMFVLLADAQ